MHIHLGKMAATFKQDMPPKGGYAPVDWKQRIPRVMSGKKIMLCYTVAWGLYATRKYYLHQTHVEEEREMTDSRVAIWPFMLAEKQRLQMGRWRENRDYENELMKDVDGWVTGTLFGEKVYVDDERCYTPSGVEFYAHNKPYTYSNSFYKRFSRY